MLFFRCLSLGLAVFSGVLIAGWSILLVGPGWADAEDTYTTLGLGAAALGILIGFGHRLASGAYESELRKLITHVESLNREGESRPGIAPPRFGLNELRRVVEQTLDPSQQRVRDLAAERRNLDVQLHASEARRRHLEAVLEAVSDAVIVTDAFDEVAVANQAAARLLEFDVEAAQRRPLDQIVNDPTLIQLIKNAHINGTPAQQRSFEHRIGHNGRSSIYDVKLTCVTNGSAPAAQKAPARSGERCPAGVVAILRDVTREKEIAEIKSDFVSNVSHELRTPLSSIKAYMEMLVDGEARSEHDRFEFYNIIQGETNRLCRLIDNILNIDRIESGLIKVQREQVSLPEVAREAIDIMLPQAQAKNIDLTLAPVATTCCVYADRDMILHSLLNYLSNAVKYTLPGGRVTVEVTVDRHIRMAHVAVTDTGVGVPAKDIPHLFEKFYRVSDHKKLAKGTGLGLNLVKHVIETVHGGHTNVTSAPDQGSTFTFSLPIAEKIDD